jgi:hypothetical protein
MRRRFKALVLALACSAACERVHDPTAILAPLPGAPAVGVQLKLGRQGDGVAAITYVWVEDSSGNNLLSLFRTAGFNSLPIGTPSQNYCTGGMRFYWPSYCAGNPNNVLDAVSSATLVPVSDQVLVYSWDWRDRNGAVVPNGTYKLKAELSGYPYEIASVPYPAEASVTVTKNGASGSATGTNSGAWQSISATWNP